MSLLSVFGDYGPVIDYFLKDPDYELLNHQPLEYLREIYDTCYDAAMDKNSDVIISLYHKVVLQFPHLRVLYGKMAVVMKPILNYIFTNGGITSAMEPTLQQVHLYLKKIFNSPTNHTLMDFLYPLKNTSKYIEEFNQYRQDQQLNLVGDRIDSGFRELGEQEIIANIIQILVLDYLNISDLECYCKPKVALSSIVPMPEVFEDTLKIYRQCSRTCIAALKRQLMYVPRPEPKALDEFQTFSEHFFHECIEPHLEKMVTGHISVSQFMNKEPLTKQVLLQSAKQIMQQDPSMIPKCVVHDSFIKLEKQPLDGKCRNISAINQYVKYITGPICWFLEDVFNKIPAGFYSGDKNADKYADFFISKMKEGYKYFLQGDGSGFDQTQHYECKYIDQLIYQWCWKKGILKEYNDEAYNLLTQPIKILKTFYFHDGYKENLCSSQIVGTVFSGAADTTLMNTIRMAVYNIFTLTRAGLKYQEDFSILTKGDDFIVFLKNYVDVSAIYGKYWLTKKFSPSIKQYGLGQIMKVLHLTDKTAMIDFCSNAFIFNKEKNDMILTQIPFRAIKHLFYSRKYVHYTNGQRKQYLIDMKKAIIASGAHNLIFYKQLINKFQQQIDKIKEEPESIGIGASKYQFQDDGLLKRSENSQILDYYSYDRDFAYKLLMHNTTKKHKITNQDVYNYFFERYGISKKKLDELVEQFEKTPTVFVTSLEPDYNVELEEVELIQNNTYLIEYTNN
jgi:hypothetical protein